MSPIQEVQLGNPIPRRPPCPHRRLLALREVVRKLGPATPILANSTCDEIDRVAQAIEIDLATVFDA